MRLTVDLAESDWKALADAAEECGVSLHAYAKSILLAAGVPDKVRSGEWARCLKWIEDTGREYPKEITKKSHVMLWARQEGWEG